LHGENALKKISLLANCASLRRKTRGNWNGAVAPKNPALFFNRLKSAVDINREA
jgi:hypothetical protein